MATFWFVSAPLFGHLDWGGFLKTALVLQSQGHEVIWVSQSPIQSFVYEKGVKRFEAVEQTGWLWPPPPPPDPSMLPPQEAMFIRYKRALDTWLSEELVREGVAALLELAERIGVPDVMATDPFLTATAIAAEKMRTKLAVCGWPAMKSLEEEDLYAVQRELAEESLQRVERLCAHFDVTGENFSGGPTPSVQSPHLHISYFSRYWFQSTSSFLPQTQFVGGFASKPDTRPPEWMTQLPDGKPLVLITLGSVFIGDPGFFVWAAQAAYRAGAHPIVVVGKRRFESQEKKEFVAALPPRTFLLNWVDFDHLMPRLNAIVHHGGMGTTHAALVHAVPQVIVPHAADQRGQAVRASQAKVGLNLSAMDVQRGQLLPAIKAIISDKSVKETCIKMAEQLKQLGGPPRAAELLVLLAQH
ncbi:MAG: glycosyltransferase [Chloroflexi bacterium]|nr:glycosyltransferase [Chloroflexota bacterium]